MSLTLLSSSLFIALAPLAAFLIILFFQSALKDKAPYVGVLAMAYAFVHSLLILAALFNTPGLLTQEGLQGHFFTTNWTWISLGSYDFQLGVLIDGLSATMLVVVTLVSLLVQIYSISYMKEHKRYGLYFAYVNLFTFSMLLLVLANSMLQMFIGWEGVGLCSYLLISFDYEREAASYAGRKAFITTKIADLGFYAGLLLTFVSLGTLNIPAMQSNIVSIPHAPWLLTAIPLLFFMGAMGKSAQFPFHVWLPDAMEGPTPASALIHAATMVAAGVFMVARVFFLFQAAPMALTTVAWVGAGTALFAATMGVVSDDIKRVLAFSTVSQLGFMMAALGCGGYTAGMFHLTTHAAFKALLFLCAGSVIHAVHTNDMWKMGGLMRVMPVTAASYFIATLAITGFPFLSGFYSKEEVFAAAYHRDPILFAMLVTTALLTSFYMFRSWFLTFAGQARDKERHHHAHESPAAMTIPLVVLAALSIGLGFAMKYSGVLERLISLGEVVPTETHEGAGLLLGLSLFVFAAGCAGAYAVYARPERLYLTLKAQFSFLHNLLSRRYYIDELYLWVIARVYYPLARAFANFDYNVIDQTIVDGVGRMGRAFASLSGLFDRRVVDDVLVDGNAAVLDRVSRVLRRLQSGLAQSYLFWMAMGLGLMVVWMAQFYK